MIIICPYYTLSQRRNVSQSKKPKPLRISAALREKKNRQLSRKDTMYRKVEI